MSIKKKIKKWSKKLSQGDIVITIILVLAILGVVNFLSYQIFWRADLTQNNIYSISEVSRETVRNLDDLVKVRVYFSEDLPSRYINLKQNINDILKEYVQYSEGNIKVENINPKDLEDRQRKMSTLGIPSIQFNVLKNDSYQVSNGYMGISVQYGDSNESIPVVKNSQDLEYKITTALKKVTREEIPVVGVVNSHGCLTPKSGLQNFSEKLQEIYQVREIDLASGEIAPEIKTLILAGPVEKFNEEELKKIDKFVMGGGSLIALADGINIKSGVIPENNETNLNELLAGYGLNLNYDIVLDGQSPGRVSFNSGFMSFSTPYPAWIKIKEENFNQENPAVADLESAVFPWPSSLQASSTAGTEIESLIRTTEYAWTGDKNYDLRPSNDLAPQGEIRQYDLAYLVRGDLKSPFGQGSTETGRVILVGDSDFISDDYLSGENLLLAQNLVDSLSLDNDLIKIRSRESTDRSIKDLSAGGKQTVKYLNIFGVSVLVVAFGLARYFWRKRKKNADIINY